MDLDYRSGRLQKIFSSRIETEIYNDSEELDWNEIAINKENLKDLGFETPLEAVYIPRSGKPKRLHSDKTVQRRIVDISEILDVEGDLYLSRGYAVISPFDNYYNEMLEEGNVVLDVTPSILEFNMGTKYELL